MGIRFIQDKYTPGEAMRLTNINNATEAYKAIESNPQFAPLLENVIPKHPAQLYEAFGYIFVFLILFFLYWKTNVREKLGFLFGLFLVLLWTVRFIVEYVKESQGGFENELGLFSTGQWLSIPFIIVGLILLIRAKKQDPIA
ncbi:MAG: prolipoprotein diacylglyceryl transferase, partial [Flavobacterium sp.]|nr:prolipoprotein diacylglyceryl transferase [Flavobacterium sp.]